MIRLSLLNHEAWLYHRSSQTLRILDWTFWFLYSDDDIALCKQRAEELQDSCSWLLEEEHARQASSQEGELSRIQDTLHKLQQPQGLPSYGGQRSQLEDHYNSEPLKDMRWVLFKVIFSKQLHGKKLYLFIVQGLWSANLMIPYDRNKWFFPSPWKPHYPLQDIWILTVLMLLCFVLFYKER